MTTKACETHCCPVHGCKYGHEDCQIATGKLAPHYPKNNGCESCEQDANDPGMQAIEVLKKIHHMWETDSDARSRYSHEVRAVLRRAGVLEMPR